MTGLQVTGHFHRYGHVGSTEMGGAKHFERPWLFLCFLLVRVSCFCPLGDVAVGSTDAQNASRHPSP